MARRIDCPTPRAVHSSARSPPRCASRRAGNGRSRQIASTRATPLAWRAIEERLLPPAIPACALQPVEDEAQVAGTAGHEQEFAPVEAQAVVRDRDVRPEGIAALEEDLRGTQHDSRRGRDVDRKKTDAVPVEDAASVATP